jgi:hypothetical protein
MAEAGADGLITMAEADAVADVSTVVERLLN